MKPNGRVIDYDNLEQWSPWLDGIFGDFAPPRFVEALAAAHFEHIEDSRNFVIEQIGLGNVVDKLSCALQAYCVRFYHGTRVTDAELQNIRQHGLHSLTLANRREKLAGTFSNHPDWRLKESQFNAEIVNLGVDSELRGAGKREDGFIHACFSRSALINDCNHYLTHGAEVDQHIAQIMFPDGSGLNLLKVNGKPRVISIDVPFLEALTSMNSSGCSSDHLPTLLDVLVGAWAYRKSHPAFTVTSQRDCVPAAIPAHNGSVLIKDVEEIDDLQLNLI